MNNGFSQLLLVILSLLSGGKHLSFININGNVWKTSQSSVCCRSHAEIPSFSTTLELISSIEAPAAERGLQTCCQSIIGDCVYFCHTSAIFPSELFTLLADPQIPVQLGARYRVWRYKEREKLIQHSRDQGHDPPISLHTDISHQ